MSPAKPQCRRTAVLDGVIRCRECGHTMEQHGGRVVSCPNEKCAWHGKRARANVETMVVLYEEET